MPTFDLFDEMVADGVEFELHRNGAIVAAKDPAVARGSLEKLEPMRKYGYELPREVISGAELHELEPALSPVITTGFVLDEQMHVDGSLSRVACDLALRRGVQISRARRSSTSIGSARVQSECRTATSEFDADAFLLAAGSWTPGVAR